MEINMNEHVYQHLKRGLAVKKEFSLWCVSGSELVEVCWLELIGKLHASKLSPGTLYQVVFIVMLREIAEGC
ncbi:hypothetical protein GQ457_05G009490 [Hibiscus cannabinus]